MAQGCQVIKQTLDKDGVERINRVNYEICVLQALREKLRCKEIWVVGAKRYCNPEFDLPQDFEVHRQNYYQALQQPLDASAFISQLQQEMTQALTMLERGMESNTQVKILKKKNGWISLSPLEAQPEPINIEQLKRELDGRWPMTSLLDMLKEADLRIGFTNQFQNTGVRSNFEPEKLQRRLLLCLYGLGTNTGLKRICAGIDGDKESDLRYVKKHYIHREHLRNAIAQIVNAIFEVRKNEIWGEGTTTCASDSKNLSFANLRGADLSGADLRGANVENAFFSKDSLGISEFLKQDLIQRGAIFEDSPGDRSKVFV